MDDLNILKLRNRIDISIALRRLLETTERNGDKQFENAQRDEENRDTHMARFNLCDERAWEIRETITRWEKATSL